ncbi:uncharacterized protein F5Z01DRAFT_215401 [Emericellopsis atlantica]|uniref:Uncharacterized protein n=1 Tax=Emericellopsis atlantica TaxID=2614577 RepID=A0A9P8CTD2_9HYPO|nr:uncharacterized protein F5Z01DRAFT_215401 [Emericellopsis atlantica]KAG9258718.1 hypothetical protein F5Z01DRAFT_215401 [Emericellopsis atlantica]
MRRRKSWTMGYRGRTDVKVVYSWNGHQRSFCAVLMSSINTPRALMTAINWRILWPCISVRYTSVYFYVIRSYIISIWQQTQLNFSLVTRTLHPTYWCHLAERTFSPASHFANLNGRCAEPCHDSRRSLLRSRTVQEKKQHGDQGLDWSLGNSRETFGGERVCKRANASVLHVLWPRTRIEVGCSFRMG